MKLLNPLAVRTVHMPRGIRDIRLWSKVSFFSRTGPRIYSPHPRFNRIARFRYEYPLPPFSRPATGRLVRAWIGLAPTEDSPKPPLAKPPGFRQPSAKFVIVGPALAASRIVHSKRRADKRRSYIQPDRSLGGPSSREAARDPFRSGLGGPRPSTTASFRNQIPILS